MVCTEVKNKTPDHKEKENMPNINNSRVFVEFVSHIVKEVTKEKPDLI